MRKNFLSVTLAAGVLLVLGAGCPGQPAPGPQDQADQKADLTNDVVLTPKTDVGVSELNATGAKPTPRELSAGVYDPKTKRFYLFGGRDSRGFQNDLFELDLVNAVWKKIEAAGERPSPRYGTPLMLDSEGGYLYLFGGQGDISPFLDDLWRFDLALRQWERIPYTDGPVGRYGHGGIFDEKNGGPVIGFGFIASGRSNETWRYNTADGKWENISPSEDTRPQKRCLVGSAHATGDNSFWLFGGQSVGVPGGKPYLGDFWRFDFAKNQWEELSVQLGIKARTWPTISALEEAVVLFGGQSADGDLNDIWIYDKTSGQWSRPPASIIPARSSHAAGVDLENNRVIIFGGQGEKLYNDVWILQL